jgi:hypothetical protein
MKVISSKKITNSEPSTVQNNLQKLQAVKKVNKITKNEKIKKTACHNGKQSATTMSFLWSNSLQPASLRA